MYLPKRCMIPTESLGTVNRLDHAVTMNTTTSTNQPRPSRRGGFHLRWLIMTSGRQLLMRKRYSNRILKATVISD